MAVDQRRENTHPCSLSMTSRNEEFRDDSSGFRDRGISDQALHCPVCSASAEGERCSEASRKSPSIPLVILPSSSSHHPRHEHGQSKMDVALISCKHDEILNPKKLASLDCSDMQGSGQSQREEQKEEDEDNDIDTLSTLSVQGAFIEPDCCEIYWPDDVEEGDWDSALFREPSNNGGSLQYSSSAQSEGMWGRREKAASSFRETQSGKSFSYMSETTTIQTPSPPSEDDDRYYTQGFVDVGNLPRVY